MLTRGSFTVNNAGIGIESFVLKEPQPELLNKLFQTNVLGPFFVVNAAAPHMPRGGRIINVSSTAAKGGTPQLSAYAASKAALDILTWNWAAEVRFSYINLYLRSLYDWRVRNRY